MSLMRRKRKTGKIKKRKSSAKHGRRKHRSSRSSSSSSSTSIASRVKLFKKSLPRRPNRRMSSLETSSAKSSSRKCLSRAGARSRSSTSSSSGRETLKSAKSKSSSVRLPTFLRQPLPRGTAAPVELKDDPKLHKRKKEPWESVADALVANAGLGIKEGENETTYPKLLERTIFALRGFGEFTVCWGNGQYGKCFTDYIRRIGSDHIEDLRINNVRCKLTNRLAVGLSTLKMGSEKIGVEDEKNLLLGDFALVSNTVLEDHVLTGVKSEKRPPQPTTLEGFRNCAENQINIWCLLFGQEYRAERETCLANLLELHYATPELFTVGFFGDHLGSFPL